MPVEKHRGSSARCKEAKQPMTKTGEPPLALELITLR